MQHRHIKLRTGPVIEKVASATSAVAGSNPFFRQVALQIQFLRQNDKCLVPLPTKKIIGSFRATKRTPKSFQMAPNSFKNIQSWSRRVYVISMVCTKLVFLILYILSGYLVFQAVALSGSKKYSRPLDWTPDLCHMHGKVFETS